MKIYYLPLVHCQSFRIAMIQGKHFAQSIPSRNAHRRIIPFSNLVILYNVFEKRHTSWKMFRKLTFVHSVFD